MVERFNSREPRYANDADYTTNTPSYYDDLARKSKLLQLLAERIWEYDEELALRFAEWDQNLEEFDAEVINLLNEWLADGVLDEVINQDLLNQKADKTELEALDIWIKEQLLALSIIQFSQTEPTDDTVEYWYQELI